MSIWVKSFSWCMFALVWLIATNVLSVLGEGAMAAPQSTDFNLNINLPTCNVEIPKEYFLGTLQDGQNSYPAFDVRVICDKSGSNNVRVLASTPNPLNVDGDVALVNGTSEFWLNDVDAGRKINLSGQAVSQKFCTNQAANGDWTCKVSPEVKINPGDPRGEFRISTIFSVYYF